MFEHKQNVEAIEPQELQCSFLSVSRRGGRLVDEKLRCALFHLCPFFGRFVESRWNQDLVDNHQDSKDVA